jgi:cellulose synthase/poly-beta-1,6-N-acetylglucosamine synthase-like glycosyltransferase
VYAEDLENAVILLSQGERIYYDGRLVVSTEGPGTLRRWFSQRVGWYHGLLKVYTERLGAIWRISKRTPFAAYHFIVYVGGLSLVLHLVKILSALLLLLSLIGGFDSLFLLHLLPRNTLTSPSYFVGAVGSYLALGVIALFTVVPKAERSYIAPIVPLYLLYALVQLLPMTVGFGNFIAVRMWGRRLYLDHYEPGTAESGVWEQGRRLY